FDPGKSKAVIPFKLINNLIFIPIDVNGVTLNFMVDSGIEETIMFGMAESGAVNTENTETMRLRGLGGAEYIECLKSSNNVLRLHGLTAFKQNVYVIPDQEFNFSSNVGI